MKRSTTMTALLLAMTLSLVACNKKEENNNSVIRRGNAQTDGIRATTDNILLSGIPVIVDVSGVTNVPSQSVSQFQDSNQCLVYGGTRRISFDLNVNGVQQKLEADATIKSSSMGQFGVWHSMGCYDAYCNLAFINVVVSPQVNNYFSQQSNGAEYAQLLLKYDFSQGRITDVRELKGLVNQILRPCDITKNF